MEEISLHLFKVYDVAREHADWMTAKDLAKASGVAERTARAHAVRLVAAGLLDVAKVFPGHRYKFSNLSEIRNKPMLDQLEATRSIFQCG